jgi:uncharacterized OB-fold protein
MTTRGGELKPPSGSQSDSWVSEPDGTVHLLASYSTKSGKIVFPPAPSGSINGEAYREQRLSSVGVIYTFTVVHPVRNDEGLPYTLAYIDFPEGVRIFGQLRVDGGQPPSIGARVRTVVRHSTWGKPDYAFEMM